MSHKWWSRSLLLLATVVYILASLNILYWLWLSTGFCDPPEESCALPWTRNRIVLWVAWVILGVALSGSALASFRPRAGWLSHRWLAVAVGALPVLLGLGLALSVKEDASE